MFTMLDVRLAERKSSWKGKESKLSAMFWRFGHFSIFVNAGTRPNLFLQLFCSRPTTEIFEHSWRPGAVFEVSLTLIRLHLLTIN